MYSMSGGWYREVGGTDVLSMCCSLRTSMELDPPHPSPGDVVELPVGGVVRKKNNPNSRQAEMARLTQVRESVRARDMVD